MATTGTIIQVIGSTFDARFPEEDLPEIYNAVTCEIEIKGERTTLVGEVAKHLGGGQVRCVALASTDGMRRGDPCADTGSPVKVPVGEAVLGRVFNLLGEPIVERGPIKAEKYRSIHRDPPVSAHASPRRRPSVDARATQRTCPPPRCLATSPTSVVVSPLMSISHLTAL